MGSYFVILGRGQLGTMYRDYFIQAGAEVKLPDIDIRDERAVHDVLEERKPDAVINAAAKTNIDWCEKNKLEAFHINTLGTANVGAVCAQRGLYLVHLSSGCVQESKSADEVRREEDPVSPLCYYSWTKIWAEHLLNDLALRQGLGVLILRPRQLLSSSVSPRNAVTKLLTYSRFIDTANSCTIVEDLLWVTDELMRRGAQGTYNVVNRGTITPYQIALLLKEMVRPEMIVEKISKNELNACTLAKRIDCVLSAEKLKALGIVLPEIHARLREIVTQFRERLQSVEGAAVLEKTRAETKQKLGLIGHIE